MERMRAVCLIRRIFDRRGGCNIGSVRSFSRLYESPISTPVDVSSLPTPSVPFKSSFCNFYSIPAITKLHFSNPTMQFRRTLCSSPGSSNIVLIKSEEEFNSSMKNIQEKSLPAIFYFTAAWCGPCKFISPILAEQSEKYPHVPTYKIDIDQV
uniref:Thioredoxin domain-containing protein n=1 Tax=Manihot esculenta TaxID=3983 RepID=A0A199UB89_MANES